jgi:cytochrome c oxidase subunit 2
MTEQEILRSELRWGGIVAGAAGLIFAVIVVTAAALAIVPPSNVELIDPTTLQREGEFVEENLGTTVGPDGSITARIVATQFAFVPQCVPLPAGKRVTIRLATPDVIHGLIVTGTNVNTMVVPGYVSQIHTVFTTAGDHLMPCHEFCGIGHSEMWGVIRVIPAESWHPDPSGKVRCG